MFFRARGHRDAGAADAGRAQALASAAAEGLEPAIRSRLFRRYFGLIATVVIVALLASGGVLTWQSYIEHRAHLATQQQEKARVVAARIGRFMADTRLQLGWTLLPQWRAGDLEARRFEFIKLLRQAPAFTEVRWIDWSGREEVEVSRVAADVIGSGRDWSSEPAFLQARATGSYTSPVYFRRDTEPYITIARALEGSAGGITIAEVNLRFVVERIEDLRADPNLVGYVIDRPGNLVAHREVNLVLQRANLADLPQVRARVQPDEDATDTAVDHRGVPVLAASSAVPGTDWHVFVEVPTAVAFEPWAEFQSRLAMLLLAGIALSIAASLILARQMARPIRALHRGAASIAAGGLDHRIETGTHDELAELATQFNRMADALHESYSDLERKVEARTAELTEALERQAAAARENERLLIELAAANQHKTEFLATMSHELRTPLNAVIGFSEALLERIFGDLNAKQDEYLHDIRSAGEHLLALITDILDLTKIDAGRMELERASFDLVDTVQASVMLVRERANRRRIAITHAVDPSIGAVVADERRVKQVLVNLLSNAVKFTPEGGRVDVQAHRTGAGVAVAVSDTGPGIPHENHELVFEAFRQGAPGTAAAAEGTGLGLALARRFAVLHGGSLTLASTPGRGSVFTLALPDASAVP